jgi:menaquinone-dependent protoporphyrinogen oxidase
MTVLVVHASQRGGTQGIAETIGAALQESGDDVRVAPASDVRDLAGVDAVVVAGALHAHRWHRDARRFVRKHQRVLSGMPVWLVASGPLDESADTGELPPTPHVSEAMHRIGARGQVTFGGFLSPDAKGFPASAMAKNTAGDWRNPERIRAWSREVHEQLTH